MVASAILLATLSWWVVEPMSPKMRLPDAEPADGVKGGEVQVLAAQGEYESGSFVLRSGADQKGVTLSWGDLTGPGGAKIPASAVDAKVVVCWYQQGTAWYGFHSDMTRRILTPELLVHDEKLVKVDHRTQDNYVRTDHADGTTDWYWTTYLPLDCDLQGGYYAFLAKWVHDAETLQPFDLEAGKCKQLWLTVGVPKGAKPGLYKGSLGLKTGDGRQEVLGTIPLVVRVLPFELPKPATFRDVGREFRVSMYWGRELSIRNDRVASDCARHNLTNPFIPQAGDVESAKSLYDALERNGLDTSMLLSHLPGAYYTMSDPPAPDDDRWDEYCGFRRTLSNAVARVRARFGEKTIPFAYGFDEAGAAKVRAERAAWSDVHALGGRTIVSTHMRNFILYGLDAACIPEQPAPMRKAFADTLHESNPEMMIGWYADPHSGPENPDLTRRQYGWQSWRNNYDMVCQYVMFVRGWAEFNRPYENDLRSLTFAYAGDRQLIDTLQFEGFREAIDDIRYSTLLKRLATDAAKSKDVDTMYLGRAALTWQAQVPYETSSLKSLRYETIDKILKILEKKGSGIRDQGLGIWE